MSELTNDQTMKIGLSILSSEFQTFNLSLLLLNCSLWSFSFKRVRLGKLQQETRLSMGWEHFSVGAKRNLGQGSIKLSTGDLACI